MAQVAETVLHRCSLQRSDHSHTLCYLDGTAVLLDSVCPLNDVAQLCGKLSMKCSVTKHRVRSDSVGGHGCVFKCSWEKWESFRNNGIIVTLFETFVLLIEVEPI